MTPILHSIGARSDASSVAEPPSTDALEVMMIKSNMGGSASSRWGRSALFVATALLYAAAPTTVLAQAKPASGVNAPAADVRKSGTVLELRENAPDRYVVQKGDTLWGISNRFLKEPWRWPEFWRFNNDQIRNPHLIYPGQVIVLDRFNTRIAIDDRVKPRVRTDATQGDAIPSIPANVIEPFLSRPLVIQPGALDSTPQIVASEEGRYNLGAGGRAYVEGIAPENRERSWQIYRPGRPLIDPETKEILGIEVIHVGSARLVRAAEPQNARPSTVIIERAQLEVTPGDRLLPSEPPRLVQYMPRAPQREIFSQVISIYGGRGEESWLGSNLDENRIDVADYDSRREAGPLQIISLNRGTRDGVEVGHVLSLNRATVVKNDRSIGEYYLGKPRPSDLRLPEERYGLVFVFRTFERVSYGLIVQAQRTVVPGDHARKP